MGAFKLTMRFNYVSGAAIGAGNRNKTGGWTESVISPVWDAPTQVLFRQMMGIRAGLLCKNASITGFRVQAVDPSARSQLFKVYFPGPNLDTHRSDVPQMGIRATFGGVGVTNSFVYRLGGVPDPWVVDGELKLPAWDENVQVGLWMTNMANFCGRGQNLALPFSPIKTIDALGNVEMNADLVVAAGDLVSVRNANLANTRKLTRIFKVDTATDFRHFKLTNYTSGPATGGQARKVTWIYPRLVPPQESDLEVCLRKIGRPSEKYVGRRSKRRT